MYASRVLGIVHRALIAAQRGLDRVERVLKEIPIAMLTPAFERASQDAHYARFRVYTTPEDQRSGLYPFERRGLAFFPPPPARLLLHGAGAGRELFALLAMGYTVDAYDPVASFVKAASAALEPGARARVEQRSVQEWIAHANDEPTGYDGVVTGWTLWTHLLQHDVRVDALSAFRRVCPSGPVLLSFWRADKAHLEKQPEPDPVHPEPVGRVEKTTRGLIRQRLLGLPPIERGTSWNAGLFAHAVTEPELREEAALGGYDVTHYEHDVTCFPFAVLTPKTADRR